jgi:hypothetical protein
MAIACFALRVIRVDAWVHDDVCKKWPIRLRPICSDG